MKLFSCCLSLKRERGTKTPSQEAAQENILLSTPCRLGEMFSRKAEHSHESLMEKAVEGISQRNAAVPCHALIQTMGHSILIHLLMERASEKLLLLTGFLKMLIFEINIKC